MSRQHKLTPVEWEIMEAIWQLGGKPSVREVLDHAFPRGEKAYTTVQTTMNTMEKKRLLRRRKIGMVNFYEPTHSREELARAEIRSLVTRIFGGSVPAVANTLLSLDGLDLEEVRQIQELLQQKEKELERGRS